MPFYYFQVDVGVPPRVVGERLRAIVRSQPPWRERFRMAWHQVPESHSQFVGTVRDGSFQVRRDVGLRRNALLPFVWGGLRSTGAGTRVTVTMFMNPLMAIFVLFWLGILGIDVLRWLGLLGPSQLHGIMPGVILCGMFLLGIVFVKSGFFDEAKMARRIISSTVLDRQVDISL